MRECGGAENSLGGCFSAERNGAAAMLIHLHKQATTTPKVRAAIQASD